MRLKNRLEKLEHTPQAEHYAWAREKLINRLQRTDPETWERVQRTIRDKAEANAVPL